MTRTEARGSILSSSPGKGSCGRVLLAWLATVLALPLAAFGMDLDRRVDFDIPAQGLSSALIQFSKQARLQVVLSDDVAGQSTQGISGQHAIKKALSELLGPAGLRYRIAGETTISVARFDAAASATREPRAELGNSSVMRLAQSAGASNGNGPADSAASQNATPSGVSAGDSASDAREEAVIVTGSRIPTVAGKQPLPVRAYGHEELEASGQTTIADFLNTLPNVSVMSVPTNIAVTGAATVQLHGLPVGTTLTLLNGNRMEPNRFGFFDINSIPAAAVERIEILPVGASAVYGADALSGAVNIITRKNFSGAEVGASYTHLSGSHDASLSAAWGKGWDRGSLMIVGTYSDTGLLLGSERAFLTGTTYPANAPSYFYVTDDCALGNIYSLDGSNLPGLSAPYAAVPVGVSGTPTLQQMAATSGTLNQCNRERGMALVPDSRRAGALMTASYEFSSAVELYTEVIASHAKTVAPYGFAIDTCCGLNMLGAANPYNPFGVDVGVSFVYEGIKAQYAGVANYLRPLVGLRGALGSDWRYDASAYVSRDTSRASDAYVDFSDLQVALDSSDPATALNPFSADSPGSPQLLRSLMAGAIRSQYRLVNRVDLAQAVTHGTLLHLPSGPVSAAFGGEYARHSQFSQGYSAQPLDLDRRTYAFFGELRVPLVGLQGDPAAGDRLTLTSGARYDHSSDFGGKGTWQGGLLWNATSALSVRASYGLSYRAPQLQEVGGPQQLFSSANTMSVDPARGNEAVIADVVFGPNPDLEPVTGTSRTLGITYSSREMPALRASLTWYSIDISRYIGQKPLQALISNPDAFPGAVVREPPTPEDEAAGYLGRIVSINATNVNFGDLSVAGFDFDVAYDVQSRIGQLTPSLAVTNTYLWESALTPHEPAIDYLNQFTIVGNGWAPRWKGTLGLAWERGPFSALLSGRYVGRYKDSRDFADNTNKLGNDWKFDIGARYQSSESSINPSSWLSGGYVAVTVSDLFDNSPPFSYGYNSYDYTQYDPRGRLVQLRLGKKW